MKFECNCKNENDFNKMMVNIHSSKCGVNFEVGARLWYKPEGTDKTIMVEHQVTTQECKELTENEDEPDWLTAYLVDDEEDNDYADELFTETIEDNICFCALKEAMLEFAKNAYARCFA